MDTGTIKITEGFPELPGVYIIKNKRGSIIYIGKAKNLKKRVSQYFRSGDSHDVKTQIMVSQIEHIEYIVTTTELEALILECNLIKKHRPRYNILLKDDKNFPYIKVTLGEDYPRILLARKMKNDRSKYFGPYRSSFYVNQTIDALSRLFKIRTCNKTLDDTRRDRACLNYHIGRCMAPCQGNVSKDEYGAHIKQICLFLSHRLDELIALLKEEMAKASQNLDFEKAARIRDQIRAIESMTEKQKVVTTDRSEQDVIAHARQGDSACVQVLFIRDGKLLEREHYFLECLGGVPEVQLMTEFIKRFYHATAFIPKEILLQHGIDEKEVIRQWLRGKKGGAVDIKVPQRGAKRRIVEIAAVNARELITNFSERMRKEQQQAQDALEELYNVLALEEFPFRIEAFDISNIQGVQQVGSMVVFEEGRPKKSDYRRYKLREGRGPDDYESMREIIARRYRKAKKNGDSMLPQLILVDGGKGHVSAVEGKLEDLGLGLRVCGMVKDDRHKTRGLLKGDVEIPLREFKKSHNLIIAIQEEAHRFAINYHRSLRGKAQVQSILDNIKGIGKKRKIELLKHFGDIDRIKKANVEELASVKGMNRAVAQCVYDFFKVRAL